MLHHERIHAVKEGSDYKAPLRAINETIEGLVHCGLIVRANEDGVLLTPEARALDAIGVQVERELRQRAEMIRACCDRLHLLEARVQDAQGKGYVIPDELLELPPVPGSLREQMERAVMPEQSTAREKLHLTDA